VPTSASSIHYFFVFQADDSGRATSISHPAGEIALISGFVVAFLTPSLLHSFIGLFWRIPSPNGVYVFTAKCVGY
jgi:hypothetical protein